MLQKNLQSGSDSRKILIIISAIQGMKRKQNTKDEYDKAVASDDPTKVSNMDLEDLAKKAMKKFKSLE